MAAQGGDMNRLAIRKKELQDTISDLESNLAELRERLSDIEEKQQHSAIDNLEDYLQSVDHKYDDMRCLWDAVLEEVQAIFQRRG